MDGERRPAEALLWPTQQRRRRSGEKPEEVGAQETSRTARTCFAEVRRRTKACVVRREAYKPAQSDQDQKRCSRRARDDARLPHGARPNVKREMTNERTSTWHVAGHVELVSSWRTFPSICGSPPQGVWGCERTDPRNSRLPHTLTSCSCGPMDSYGQGPDSRTARSCARLWEPDHVVLARTHTQCDLEVRA